MSIRFLFVAAVLLNRSLRQVVPDQAREDESDDQEYGKAAEQALTIVEQILHSASVPTGDRPQYRQTIASGLIISEQNPHFR